MGATTTAAWNVPNGAIILTPSFIAAKRGLGSIPAGTKVRVASSYENGSSVVESTATTFRIEDPATGALRLLRVNHTTSVDVVR